MFHACLVSTLLCFVYTLRYFYMFFWTNLLTRCHGASCLFSSVFGSRKGRKSIFSELDGTKAKVNILPWGTRSLNTRRRRVTRGHTPWPRGWAHLVPRGVAAALAPPASPLRL